MKRLAIFLVLLLSEPAMAQQTQTTIQNAINTNITTNGQNKITGDILNQNVLTPMNQAIFQGVTNIVCNTSLTQNACVALFGYANVAWWGAKCDGTTDDTTAIQTVFNLWANSAGPPEIYLPGLCKISAPIVVPFTTSKILFGSGSGSSGLVQATNNTPILQTSAENTWGIYLHDFGLSYATQQTTSDTNSYALAFSAATGTGQGFYRWSIDRVDIRGSYIGMGIDGTTGQSLPVWDLTSTSLHIYNTAHAGLSLASPVTIGMPVNKFTDLVIDNSGVVPDGQAIYSVAAEILINGLDIEGWYNEAIQAVGGSPFTANQVHIEHHTWNVPSSLFYNANAAMTITDLDISGNYTAGYSVARMFYNASGGILNISNVILGVTTTAGGTPILVGAASGASVYLHNIFDDLGTVSIPVQAGDTTSLAQIQRFDTTTGTLLGTTTTAVALLNTSAVPTLTSCGTSTPSVATGSTNQGGQFTTGGTTGTACTVTFANAYPNYAYCTVSNASSSGGTPYISAQSKSAFTVTGTVDSGVYNYACNGN